MAARVTCGCGWTGGPCATAARAAAMADKHVCKDQGSRAGVRRATRSYRCRRCGLEATYENASATEARHWFSKHSCAKREQAMFRGALHQQRLDLIDRTPKPCGHKYADHQHGTSAAYTLDACRCLPCSKAKTIAENQRRRLKAYGRYHKYVSAEHVRAHLTELATYGIGLKQVAKLSGVSTGTLSKIMFGVYADTGTGGGRNGAGVRVREPNRRVLRSTAEKIYAIEPIPANLGAGQVDHERTDLARTHLRALVALGWSQAKLAVRLGMLPTNLGPVIGTSGSNPGRTLTRSTVDKIEILFADLCMTPAPPSAEATRARNYATVRGWLPPLALDDLATYTEDAADVLDLLPAVSRHDTVDHAIVQRVLDRLPRPRRLTRAEAGEVERILRGRGLSTTQIERDYGLKPERYHRRTPDQEEAS